jgi:hypothetical protein
VPAIDESLRGEPEPAGAVPVLEDRPGGAERGAGGQQVGDGADERQQRRLQREHQQREPEQQNRAEDEWRFDIQRRLQVEVLHGGAADLRAGWKLLPRCGGGPRCADARRPSSQPPNNTLGGVGSGERI